jgi:hypothetical protein
MDDNPRAASRLRHGDDNDRNKKYRIDSNGNPERRSLDGQRKPKTSQSQSNNEEDSQPRKREDIYSDVFDALARFGIGL